MDELDDFYDTISVNSTASSRRNRNSITQSRHTVYHSAEDLELLTLNMDEESIINGMENGRRRGSDKQSKVSDILSYAQWRNRVTFSKQTKHQIFSNQSMLCFLIFWV